MDLQMFMKNADINKGIIDKGNILEKERTGLFIDKTQKSFGEMTEDEKNKLNAVITQKLKSGKMLSPKEVAYLRQTNPQLYMQYLRIRASADAMKEQFKNAKTKEQANNIFMMSTNAVSDKDPCKEYVLAALQRAADEFRKSPKYARLPDTDEDIVNKKKNKQYRNDNDNEEDDDTDFESWSPLDEIIENMPKFNVIS